MQRSDLSPIVVLLGLILIVFDVFMRWPFQSTEQYSGTLSLQSPMLTPTHIDAVTDTMITNMLAVFKPKEEDDTAVVEDVHETTPENPSEGEVNSVWLQGNEYRLAAIFDFDSALFVILENQKTAAVSTATLDNSIGSDSFLKLMQGEQFDGYVISNIKNSSVDLVSDSGNTITLKMFLRETSN